MYVCVQLASISTFIFERYRWACLAANRLRLINGKKPSAICSVSVCHLNPIQNESSVSFEKDVARIPLDFIGLFKTIKVVFRHNLRTALPHSFQVEHDFLRHIVVFLKLHIDQHIAVLDIYSL